MNYIKKNWKKGLAMVLAIVMCVMAMPMSAFAAVASDLPDNMADHAILRALEYTGYDVQKQKDDGTLYQSGSYGSRTPTSVLSGINYGTSTSGKETVADSSTVTGKAPDIATFKSKGLCCASFVTYFVLNYMPNIEGIDTQYIRTAIDATGMNSQAVITWQTALNKLANEGKIEKIGTNSSNVDRNKLAPGDLIIFGNDENSHTHIAVYSGTYNGTDFLIHVGNDRGPEIMPVKWMSDSSNGAKASYPNAYFHFADGTFSGSGDIEIYKKDDNGKALAGAIFTATSTTGEKLTIGPTNANGYASVTADFGTYTIKETVFPTNYRASGTSSWTITLDSSTPNKTITINAVNELIPGNCKIVKTSEDGKVDGIDFTITGNGVNKTVTTANGGQITVKDLKPGTYTVTEESIGKYEPQDSKSVTVVSSQTATVNFSNTLKRGNLKVTKTSEDGLVEGMQFKLSGTSLSGETIEQYAVTNAKGIATFSDVLISGNVKYTLTEVNTAARYEIPASQSVAVEWNKVTEASVYNKLKRGDLKITKTSEDGMVEGVKFRLTGTSLSGKKIDLTATTNANGVALFEDVLITGHSSYTVTEVDTKDYYITPAAQSVSIAWNEVTNKSFYNELKRGDLRVQKTSEDGFVEDMRFRLTGTSDSGIKVDETAYTDANGVAVFEDILIGKNYTLQEVNTPTRYVVPAKQTVDIAWDTVTGASVENILKKWRADVFKVDGYLYWGNPEEDNGLVPVVMSLDTPSSDEVVDDLGWPYGETQGDATLEGAVYGVYKNGDLVDTYTTDKNGWFITKYYPCGDNNEWTIKEITASEGYLLDPTVYYVDAHPGNYTVELNTEYIDVYEAIIRGKIALIKHADDGSIQIEHPEENAVFEVFLKSAGSYENARETERALLETDEYGFAETPDWLPYGVYTVKQTKGLEGKELMPPFDVRINEDGKTYRYLINNATFEAEIEIVKKDAETGKIIPASGIGFKVRNTDTGEYVIQHINYPTPMDIEIYYTDTTGKLMLPYALPYGNYEIIEQNTCYGYVLDSTPVAFKVDGSTDLVSIVKKNYAQKGTITISKFGEVFSSVTEKDGIYQPVYEIKGLEGAVYEVIAVEDVITLDGTVRYTKGQVVATVTTGKDGTATTEPLYLGKYEIREVKAPYGMIINKEPVNVELVYAGELVEITSTSASFTNERQKIVIDLKKTMEHDDIFNIGSNGEITNVQFGLYAAKDMTAADGKVIPKDALLETAYCDKLGNIVFVTDLPVGASVYVKEIHTDCHYILSDEIYGIDFEYEGQETETVRNTVNGGEAIENKIIRGSILGKKIDEDGFTICGALFGLFRADATEFTEDTAILTCESNEIGVFYFEDVPYGEYIVREIKSAPAFVLNETNYEVTIKDDGEIVELEIENKFITGTVKTIKVDKDYPENTLAGAVFEIYVDVDNNKEFNAEIDLLVGEMTESENGIHTYEKLRYNGYFLHEKTAPEGFLKDDGYYYFEIRVDGKVVTVENEAGVGFINQAIKGNVEITKVDAEFTDTKLDGAVFKIYADTNANGEYDAEDKFVTELVGKDGIYRAEGVRYGDYFLIEESAPEGFLADTTVFKFEIRNDGETITIANTEDGLFVNKPITGELEITKTDVADGKPLANVGFRIKDENGNTVVEGYTDENGVAKFTLRYGKYTYTEFDALDGYYENTEEYPFEIKEDGQIIKAQMTNEKIPVPEVPQTGDNSNLGFWIGLCAIALGGLISTAIIAVKRKKDDED
ncbi:MAG: LPXTG cell wall anchor domain-containing protein [Clostridia bacterium]|nr:LPXTG cell wall anchor domain-containing protein [Clostridia bacterium]